MSDFRDLFHEAVDHVTPSDRLDDIRTRVSEEATMNRRWIAPLAAAAAVAAVIGGFVALQGGDPSSGPEVPPATSPTSTAPSPSEAPSPPSTTKSKAVPVYFVGDTPYGPRLYREFHKATCEGPDICLAEVAVADALTSPPADSDYRTPWPAGTKVGSVLTDGDTLITVDLGPLTLHDRPAGMSQRDAELAIEQVIYTAQGAYGKGRLPVQLLLDGRHSDTILGVATAEPLANGPVLETLAHMNLTAPAEGAAVTGGSLAVSGVSNSFEAHVGLRITPAGGGEPAWTGFATAAGWGEGKLFPFETTVDVSDLAPGTYVLEASTDDPSGGAEGNGPYVDTRTITVR